MRVSPSDTVSVISRHGLYNVLGERLNSTLTMSKNGMKQIVIERITKFYDYILSNATRACQSF
jgi:hypothetical protein